MNQYNRKRIIQSKIKYEPVDFTFHDDNASQITAMWNAYYQYYYADSWNPELGSKADTKTYNRRNIYDPSLSGDMQYGYRGDSFTGQPRKTFFFQRHNSLWLVESINTLLIHLSIQLLQTGQATHMHYAQPDGTMQHNMTIDYETVTHNTGEFDLEEDGPKGIDAVTGFGQEAYYDYTDSPNEDLGFNNTLGGFA